MSDPVTPCRIEVAFTSADEKGQELLAAVNQFPPYSVERAEMEAHLFMVLARVAWRQADRLRDAERQRDRRERRRAAAKKR